MKGQGKPPKGGGDARQQAAAAVEAAAAATAAAAAARSASYRPPNVLRARSRVAPAYTPNRFDQEVLGGRLWHPACQAAAGADIGEQIPLSFASLDEYVCTFDPLVLEEAREGLKSDWAESCAGGRAWAVEVVSVEEVADGWCNVRVRAVQGHNEMKRACTNNTVVVLTEGRPPQRGAIEWAAAEVAGGGRSGSRANKRQRLDAASAAAAQSEATEADAPSASVDSSGGGNGSRRELAETAESSAAAGAAAGAAGGAAAEGAGRVVAGLVRRGREDDLLLQLHPSCTHHARDRGACCWAALDSLLLSASGGRSRWTLAPGKSLISSQREFDAVHRVRQVEKSLLRFMLKPQLLTPIGAYYENPEVRRSLWPEQAAQPQFIQYLRQRYDETQLEAIEMAACHLGAPEAAEGGVSHPLMPFVLIQGPPGTGKTHTVKGMLNVWHLVAFQRYYDGLIAATTPAAAGQQARPQPQLAAAAAAAQRLNASGSNIMEVASSMLSNLGRAVEQTKPRILVCTPSNAACDELLTRVMSEGFCDGSGRVYRPNVVRVGADQGGVNPTVRDRLVGLMVERYRNMSQGDWQHKYAELQQRHSHVSRELEALEISLGRAAKAAAAAAEAAAARGPGGGRGGASGGGGGSGGSGSTEQKEAAVAAQHQHMELAKRLVERAQQQARYGQELGRLEEARDLVWGRRDQEWLMREKEQSIEASFLSEAEMVFTTLSSTQRKVFQQSANKAPFHTVLIDEAGQASEVAALQPLVFGAKRVVLVGDPQQLPATILSELAKQVQMERSLFERLQQQGAPVKMLSVQYRMHPAIRQFPSHHFYGGRLRDADAIRDTPPALFYEHPLMKPYVFFDVAKGQERRREGGGSLSNRAEALMAACLFAELRQYLITEAQQQPGSVIGPTSVGVITPYREQRKLLRDTFEEVCGKGPASEVFIETVDSFQGKQLDVVILSCVRASTGGGLGFVNDIRRMNVAITRAKRSLWVLGSRATLRSNPEWAALISDAEERGVVIEDAEAADLFPDLPYWQQQQQAAAEQQQQAAGMQAAVAEGLDAPAGPQLVSHGIAAVGGGSIPAPATAAEVPRQQQQQQAPPKPMVSLQRQMKHSGAALPHGPMQRLAAEQQQQQQHLAGPPAPPPAVARPMQRQPQQAAPGVAKQAAAPGVKQQGRPAAGYPSLPTKR